MGIKPVGSSETSTDAALSRRACHDPEQRISILGDTTLPPAVAMQSLSQVKIINSQGQELWESETHDCESGDISIHQT